MISRQQANALGIGRGSDNYQPRMTFPDDLALMRKHMKRFSTRLAINSYLAFYNQRRPHSRLEQRTYDQVYFDLPLPESLTA